MQDQGDQRDPHDSGRDVDSQYLSNLGILHYNYPDRAAVDALAAKRGYKNRDEITISPGKMGDIYEEKVKSFFHEHLHEDEEIRYILDGGGYFDVRSGDDDWVRIELEKHDLMIMPAGIYHRFTTNGMNVRMVVLKTSPIAHRVGLDIVVYKGDAFIQGRAQVDAVEQRSADGR